MKVQSFTPGGYARSNVPRSETLIQSLSQSFSSVRNNDCRARDNRPVLGEWGESRVLTTFVACVVSTPVLVLRALVVLVVFHQPGFLDVLDVQVPSGSFESW